VQVGKHAYDLLLNCDVNTRGHTQWFFFRVRNMQSGVDYKINIINMMKPDSLFALGMRPVVYSEADAALGTGWVRAGSHICYFPNQYSYVPASAKKKKPAAASAREATHSFHTLSLSLSFPHDDDVAYVAQCYPFTYSMLQRSLTSLASQTAIVRRECLALTCGGNPCDLLTVTDFSASEAEIAARKVVVVSARVHPGESNASWMMQGLLDAVTSDSEEAALLRRTIVLKIVPMLNPDGVILGNYRCGLAGVDLNRQWSDPNEQHMPTIYNLKKMMRGLVAQDQLMLFCDLHGHSRKPNIFVYGCEGGRTPRLVERIFPRLLANCPHFNFSCCSFKVLRSKETTGRVVVWRQFGMPHSFTLEASFCGADFGAGAGLHFNTAHLKEMGAEFVPALLALADSGQARVNAIMAELEAALPAPNDASDEEDGEQSFGDDSNNRRRSNASTRTKRNTKPPPPLSRRKSLPEAKGKKTKKPLPSAPASAAPRSAGLASPRADRGR